MDDKLKTSEEWQKLYPNPLVLDPDGWNRDDRFNFEWYEELITFDEYKNLVFASTCKYHKGKWFEFMTKDELAISREQP